MAPLGLPIGVARKTHPFFFLPPLPAPLALALFSCLNCRALLMLEMARLVFALCDRGQQQACINGSLVKSGSMTSVDE